MQGFHARERDTHVGGWGMECSTCVRECSTYALIHRKDIAAKEAPVAIDAKELLLKVLLGSGEQ